MKKNLSKSKIVMILIIFIISNIINIIYAKSLEDDFLSFYFGVSGFYSNVHFKENYGSNMFAKSFVGANGFFVYMFNNSLGFEFGYPIERTKHNTIVMHANQYIAGNPMSVWWTNGILTSAVKQRHPYLGLMLSSDINNELAISTLLGIASYNIHAKYNVYQPSMTGLNQTVTFSKTKRIPVVRLSLDYKINHRYVIRVFTTWRKTSKVQITSEQGSSHLIELKNSFSSGIGVACGVV